MMRLVQMLRTWCSEGIQDEALWGGILMWCLAGGTCPSSVRLSQRMCPMKLVQGEVGKRGQHPSASIYISKANKKIATICTTANESPLLPLLLSGFQRQWNHMDAPIWFYGL